MDLSKNKNLSKKVEVAGNDIVPYLLDLTEFMHNSGLEIKPYPRVKISKDFQFANEIFGRTAYYQPQDESITLYTAGRHPKDVLRSYAHEVVHHAQNLRGELSEEVIEKLSDPAYAQKDKHLEKMEAEAYLRGNLLFRSWEDQFKQK